MIKFLSKKSTILYSNILAFSLLIIVAFIISPMMDGGNGLGVVKLQLSFDKSIGIDIINSWGELGIAHFKKWIFIDYIYAFFYSLAFATVLAFLLVKSTLADTQLKLLTLLPFVAGLLDWIENTMELAFIRHPESYSAKLFYLHSIVSTSKFTIIFSLMILMLILWRKSKNKTNTAN